MVGPLPKDCRGEDHPSLHADHQILDVHQKANQVNVGERQLRAEVGVDGLDPVPRTHALCLDLGTPTSYAGPLFLGGRGLR